MSDEMKEKVYKQIPRLMHNFPHIHMMQQKQQSMMQQQREAMQRQGMEGRGVSPEDLEAMQQSGLMSLVSTEQGREKLQLLASRVQKARARLEGDVATWDEQKKLSYWENFADHPLLEVLSTKGSDPMAKLITFIEMNDDELDQTMTLVVALSSDNGALLQKLRSSAAAAASSSGNKDAAQTKQLLIHNLVNMLGSVGQMGPPPAGSDSNGSGGHDHSRGHSGHSSSHGGHDHNHDHGHGHSCSHHGHEAPKPDISKGKTDKIER